MKPKRWNTGRLALYGAFGGAVISIVREIIEPTVVIANFGSQGYTTGYIIGYIIGGAVGGSILVAIVSGVRNLIIR